VHVQENQVLRGAFQKLFCKAYRFNRHAIEGSAVSPAVGAAVPAVPVHASKTLWARRPQDSRRDSGDTRFYCRANLPGLS